MAIAPIGQLSDLYATPARIVGLALPSPHRIQLISRNAVVDHRYSPFSPPAYCSLAEQMQVQKNVH